MRQCLRVKIIGGLSKEQFLSIDGHQYPVFKDDTMIANIGCSFHLVGNGDCLEEVEKIQETISGIGEGQMLVVKKGKMRCAFQGTNGSTVHHTRFPVKVVQGLQKYLFSVTAELSNKGILSRNGRKSIVLKYKDGQNIVFVLRYNT